MAENENQAMPIEVEQAAFPNVPQQPAEIQEIAEVERVAHSEPEEHVTSGSKAAEMKKATSLSEKLMSMIGVISYNQPNLIGTTLFSDGWIWQDSERLTGQQTAPQRSFSWRMDHWGITKWVFAQNGGGSQQQFLGRNLFDRIELRHTNQPLIAPFGVAVALTENLISDPTAARNTIVNPVVAAPDLKTLVCNSVAGRKESDDVVWALRLLSMFTNWRGAAPVDSRVENRLRAEQLTPPEITLNRFRFLVPADEVLSVGCYYANANQFASFLRGAPAYGLVPQNLDDYSVIPVRVGEYGIHLLYLAMASLDSDLWSQWLGYFYTQSHFVDGADVGHDFWVRQHLRSKALQVHYPGPKGPVIFVFVDDAGTSEPTAPQNLGWGQAVPCLIEADPQQHPANIWTAFQELMGNGWTDDGGDQHWNDDPNAVEHQDPMVGRDLEHAFRWLQMNIMTAGVEEHVYAVAAHLWYETTLVPQPVQGPVQEVAPQLNVVAPAGIQRGGMRAMRTLNAPVNNPGAGSGIPEPAAGWYPGGDADLGVGQWKHYVLPNSQQVPVEAAPYVDNVVFQQNGTREVGRWEWELLKVDCTMSLRNCERNYQQVQSETVTDMPTNEASWRTVAVPALGQTTAGVAKVKLPAPDNIGRLAVGMAITKVAGVRQCWNSLHSVFLHCQLLANCVLSGVCSLMAIHSLSPAVWMGLVDPVPRYAGKTGDLAFYDNIHSLFAGSGSISTIAENGTGSGASYLRRYAYYLRRDANLRRYFMLPLRYAEMMSNVNKLAGEVLLRGAYDKLAWTVQMWQGNAVSGWMDRSVVPDFLEYVLASTSLDVTQGWPGVRTTAVGDVLAPIELTGFSADQNWDRMGYMCATGEITVTPAISSVFSTYVWAGSWSEQQPNNQSMLTHVVRPIIGAVNGVLRADAVYPHPSKHVDVGGLANEARRILEGEYVDDDGQRPQFFDGGARMQRTIGGERFVGSVGLPTNWVIPGVGVTPAG